MNFNNLATCILQPKLVELLEINMLPKSSKTGLALHNNEGTMDITIYENDLPSNVAFKGDIAVDTEATGLNYQVRDRLCLIQISDGDGKAHLVKFTGNTYNAPNLKKILEDKSITKLFHFGRFDIGIIKKCLNSDVNNVYCTKTASKLVRTYTDSHGLKDLCKELLNVNLNKHQQSSDWAAAGLSKEQQEYAACDVLYLHRLREKLDFMLEREGRMELAKKLFDFLQTRVELDMNGWADIDIFAH